MSEKTVLVEKENPKLCGAGTVQPRQLQPPRIRCFMSRDPVYADLHTHTTCSDGRRAPDDLVRRAAERGLRVLSVTDHDTVEGLDAARAEAAAHDLCFLDGVELSVTLDGDELHLLAYGLDPQHEGLKTHLRRMQEARRDRAWTIVDRLRERGLEVEDEQLRDDIATTHAVGRPHVAEALVRAGHVGTVREAFDRYLGQGGPGYVAKPAFAAQRALDLVHDAGGIGVLAHPGHWTSSSQIRGLVDAGLDGLEITHPSHDASLRGYYERLARGYDLILTGGSDYHGRTEAEDKAFGTMGMTRREWERFRAALA
jgi:hypothetical protein